MSTVVASVFMEKRRCSPQQPASTARRNLFGPVDHEQTRRLLQREMSRISRQDKKRWNYDFQRDVPLSGRYEWTPVPGTTPSETKETSQTTPPAPANSPSPTSSPPSGVKLQTSITDFMRQRKRLPSSKTPGENVVTAKKSKAS